LECFASTPLLAIVFTFDIWLTQFLTSGHDCGICRWRKKIQDVS